MIINNEVKVNETIAPIKIYINYLKTKQCPKNMIPQIINIYIFLIVSLF